ncbi:type II toxin-antitoxin system VapC family toxin [bacterium]|nr:type II toxin-antitoxin system VapC family toxin [bacterium]
MKTISRSYLKKTTTGTKVLIDTNIIIYLTDSIQPYEGLSRLLFELIEQGDIQAVFSMVTIAEVMQGPLRQGYRSNAMQVKDYLLNFPNTLSQEITLDVLSKIGTDNRVDWSKLRTSDALIIASGLFNDVDIFISNDYHFKQAIPNELIISFEK